MKNYRVKPNIFFFLFFSFCYSPRCLRVPDSFFAVVEDFFLSDDEALLFFFSAADVASFFLVEEDDEDVLAAVAFFFGDLAVVFFSAESSFLFDVARFLLDDAAAGLVFAEADECVRFLEEEVAANIAPRD